MTAPTTPSPERQPADAGGGLLPCPWCGGELYVSVQDIDNFIGHVECGGCDMRGPISEWKYEDPEEAKADAVERWNAAWNRRSPAPQAQPDARAVEGEPVAWRWRFKTDVDGDWTIRTDGPSYHLSRPDIEVQFLYLSAPAADDGWRPTREEVARAINPVLANAVFDGPYAPRSAMGLALEAADRVLALHPAAPTDEVGKS